MGDYFVLVISCILINNILLAQYLGNCPFLGTSKKMETAVGMGMAVIFVLVLAGVITWMVETYILKKFELEFFQNIGFHHPGNDPCQNKHKNHGHSHPDGCLHFFRGP